MDLGLPPGHTMSLPVMPTQGSPLIVGVNGDPVLLPGDEGFGEPVDLALEAGHTALLAHGGLGMHVEVCHGWRKKRRCAWGGTLLRSSRTGEGVGASDRTAALTLPPTCGNISPKGTA